MSTDDRQAIASQQVVFIDSDVSDIQDLITGLAPGVQAFVLDPASDGVQQIANILAADDLTDLTSISIVGHGATGEIQLGSSVLDTSDLSSESAGLAQIGAALAPGGDLQLYACDVASGTTGQQFIADLSQYVGGAAIAASSNLVGAAAEGGSWTLNTDVGAAEIASPFTAAATTAYSGLLGLASNQIFFSVWNGVTNPANPEAAGNRVEQFGVSGSSEIGGSTIDLADGNQSANSNALGETTGIAVDTALNKYFVASYNTSTFTWTLQEGATTGGNLTTFYTDPFPALNANLTPGGQPITGTAILLGGLALDASAGKLYFAQDAENYQTGDYVFADTGIYQVNVSGGTPTLLTSTSSGLSNPNYMALDASANLLFVSDSIEAADGFPAVDNLDVVNLTTGAVTVLKSFFNASDSVDLLQGLAVNGNTLYLTTVNHGNAASAANAILSIPFTVSGSGSTATASVGAVTTLYSGSGADQPTDIVIDAAHSLFYTTGETPVTEDGTPGDTATIFEGSLSGGTSLTPVLSMPAVTGAITATSSAAFDTNAPQLVLLTQPIITANGAVTAVTGGAAVTVDTGVTVSDADGQNLAGATASGTLAGDTLSFNGGNPRTFTDGGQIRSSFSGGVLTLSGNATAADYQTALDSVTFATTSTNTAPRTIAWTVTDGVVTSTTASSTVNVHGIPTVTAGATATFHAGGAAMTLDTGLTLSDPSSATLVSATISIGGFISGDTLTVSTNGGLTTGFSAGVLTLSGSASLATYRTALDSIAYSFSPSNGDPTDGGTNLSRTISWVVNDGISSSNAATSTVNVRTPPALTTGATADYAAGGTAVAVDSTLTVTDDESNTISGATIGISSGFLAGDTLNFTNQHGITQIVSNGTLTLTGAATVANYQAAIDSITYSSTATDPTNSGADPSRTISYSVTDSLGEMSPAATSAIDFVACYCRGAMILTPDGEVAVEDLAMGDLVVTLSGEARAIRWIGRRGYDGRFVAGNRDVLPICIKPNAIMTGVPARDLWVSPEHSLYIDGVLVQAKHLANGASVVQAEQIDEVEYFHIELEAHDVIYADGMPAETFVDCDNRLMFANGAEYARLYPNDDTRPRWQFCAPRLDWGSPELVAIRDWMFERARQLGYVSDNDPGLHLVVDGATRLPVQVAGNTYRFEVPAGCADVWIASQSFVPAEREATSCDTRRLGVPMERIVLSDADLSIEAWHGHPAFDRGFYFDEASHRWTDGRARIPAALFRPFVASVTFELFLAADISASQAAA